MSEEEEDNNVSGVNCDISAWLEDKFNFPNSGSDNDKPVQSESGFDQWLNDKFRQ